MLDLIRACAEASVASHARECEAVTNVAWSQVAMLLQWNSSHEWCVGSTGVAGDQAAAVDRAEGTAVISSDGVDMLGHLIVPVFNLVRACSKSSEAAHTRE